MTRCKTAGLHRMLEQAQYKIGLVFLKSQMGCGCQNANDTKDECCPWFILYRLLRMPDYSFLWRLLSGTAQHELQCMVGVKRTVRALVATKCLPDCSGEAIASSLIPVSQATASSFVVSRIRSRVYKFARLR